MPTLALLVATLAGAAPSPAPRPGVAVDAVVAGLHAADPAERARATRQLSALAEAGLAPGDAARLLRAATGTFPKPDGDALSAPEQLVRAAGHEPATALVPVVEEVYARLPAGARTEALLVLMRVEARAGAEAVVRLLRGDRAAHRATALRTDPLRREPRHADVYFPALLEFAQGESLFPVYAALLAACEAHLLAPFRLEAVAPRALAAWKPLRDRARAAEAQRALGWPWNEEYAQAREEAGLLLDVLGYLPGDDVRGELRGALALRDPKLALFASIAALRSGGDVPAPVLDRVAAAAEVRSDLYEALRTLDRTALFPARWRTQPAFAESELVRWLTFPTELGRPPDEIELVRVVSEKVVPEGFYDWYLFRFRTLPPHAAADDGWLAGVAGPFRRADAPSPDAYGDTFSAFRRWDAATPEEHVRDVRRIIAEWNERRAEHSKE